MTHHIWLNEKPEFTEDCILICATKWGFRWDYSTFQIAILNGYVQWLTIDGEEYGDIEDLTAEKYMTIPQL